MNQPQDLPRLEFEWPTPPDAAEVLKREWLLTNGLGGYAAGTLALCNTRRYHGLFIPSLAGRGRTVLLRQAGTTSPRLTIPPAFG